MFISGLSNRFITKKPKQNVHYRRDQENFERINETYRESLGKRYKLIMKERGDHDTSAFFKPSSLATR